MSFLTISFIVTSEVAALFDDLGDGVATVNPVEDIDFVALDGLGA